MSPIFVGYEELIRIRVRFFPTIFIWKVFILLHLGLRLGRGLRGPGGHGAVRVLLLLVDELDADGVLVAGEVLHKLLRGLVRPALHGHRAQDRVGLGVGGLGELHEELVIELLWHLLHVVVGQVELGHELVRGVGALAVLGQPRDAPDDCAVLVLILGLAGAGLHEVLLGGLHGPHEPVDTLHLPRPPVGRLDRSHPRREVYVPGGQSAFHLKDSLLR